MISIQTTIELHRIIYGTYNACFLIATGLTELSWNN